MWYNVLLSLFKRPLEDRQNAVAMYKKTVKTWKRRYVREAVYSLDLVPLRVTVH